MFTADFDVKEYEIIEPRCFNATAPYGCSCQIFSCFSNITIL